MQTINQKRVIVYDYSSFHLELDRALHINTERKPLILNLFLLLMIFASIAAGQELIRFWFALFFFALMAISFFGNYYSLRQAYYTMSIDELRHYGMNTNIYSYICVADTYVWLRGGNRIMVCAGDIINKNLLEIGISKVEIIGNNTYIAEVRRSKEIEFSQAITRKRIAANSLGSKNVGK